MAAIALTFGLGAVVPACADTLPTPDVVRAPTTFTWHGTTRSGAAAAGQPHFIQQGEATVPIQTIEQRSAAIAIVTQQRYAAAMALNRVRGAGVRVTLRSARY